MPSSAEQVYCLLDYETFSEADLKTVGVHEYAKHPSTEILCVAWAIGTKEELKTAKIQTGKIPELIKILKNNKIKLIAHSAAFEKVITKYVLKQNIPDKRWICTATMAAAQALPRKLEAVCEVLNLPHQKDKEGHRLMLKLSKPRNPSKLNPSTRHKDPEELDRLLEYCVADIKAEIDLFLSLPELSAYEKKVWYLDQVINQRGFRVDSLLIADILHLIEKETKALDEETAAITHGELNSTRQTAKTLAWLQERIEISNLQAKTLLDILDTPISDEVARIIEIRQDISKTSTAKYNTFYARSQSDGRCRDNLLYHGSHTGRFSGQGVQIQNLSRGKIKNPEKAIPLIHEGDLEWIRALYKSPMELFSSCLRSVIIADEGKEFFCADYAAIETRVLFWLAKHQAGIKAFKENRDLYVEMAAEIFRKDPKNVTKEERFLGKTSILGCGYGVGKNKFQTTCENYGVPVSEELAENAVGTYRRVHSPIPALWANLERAAVQACLNPDKKYSLHYTKWCANDRYLSCELPSGRKLIYWIPEVKYEATPWGNKSPKIYCWGVNSVTKKWERYAIWGGVFVENVVQAISRDLMVHAMLNIEASDYEIVLTVHDEILAERKKGNGCLKEFEDLMVITPEWGKEIPIKTEGWVGNRYRKG